MCFVSMLHILQDHVAVAGIAITGLMLVSAMTNPQTSQAIPLSHTRTLHTCALRPGRFQRLRVGSFSSLGCEPLSGLRNRRAAGNVNNVCSAVCQTQHSLLDEHLASEARHVCFTAYYLFRWWFLANRRFAIFTYIVHNAWGAQGLTEASRKRTHECRRLHCTMIRKHTGDGSGMVKLKHIQSSLHGPGLSWRY